MTEQAAPQPRKPLTDVTWETFGSSYFSANVYAQVGQGRFGWPVLSDLAHELHAEHPHLDFESCSVLVDGTVNGMPVLVTWKNGLREISVIRDFGHWEHSRISLAQWGFTSHPYLAEVDEVRAASVVLGILDQREADPIDLQDAARGDFAPGSDR
jgi:hypothetical protein